MTDATIAPPAQPLQLTINPAPASFWSGSGPNFKDLLDTINPLQHIPVVSGIYQSLTGDKPSPGANVAGGVLFGGVIGLVGSVMSSVVENETGASIGGNILAAIQKKPVPAIQAYANNQASFASNANVSSSTSAKQRFAYDAYVQTQRMMA